MDDAVRQHMTVIVAVLLLGVIAGAFALLQLRNAAGSLDVGAFSLAVFVIPCVIMVICSFIIMMTAQAIGRQLFAVVVLACFAFGVVSMVVTSGWFADATITDQLLANSPEGTVITVPVQNMVVVLRDIAAFVVAPTVGSIAGAWVGSRLHPMTSSK